MILIIEDNIDHAEIIALLAGKLGEASLITDTAEKALLIIPQQHLELIIVDIGLPGMGGAALVSILKADPHTKRIPLLVLTAQNRNAFQDVFELADDFITKPFGNMELTDHIRILMVANTAALI